jgi:MerR family transcriptional regulator, copper efflux regulator
LSKGDRVRIRQLIERTGVVERQLRYLISEGFVPPPRGGRANADYGEDHVEAIRRYARLRDLGFPPAAIKLLLQAREGVPLPVAPGVTLVIAPELLAAGAPVAPLLARIETLLADALNADAPNEGDTNAAPPAQEGPHDPD